MRKRLLLGVLTGFIMTGSVGAAYGSPAATDPAAGPQTVTPRGGTLNARPIPWQKAEVLDSRTVRLLFSSGVEPCHVLDHVTVGYGASEVSITLYEGSDPLAGNQACIQIAVEKAVEVVLNEPLGGRTVSDGSSAR